MANLHVWLATRIHGSGTLRQRVYALGGDADAGPVVAFVADTVAAGHLRDWLRLRGHSIELRGDSVDKMPPVLPIDCLRRALADCEVFETCAYKGKP
jgi:hypothetical protein